MTHLSLCFPLFVPSSKYNKQNQLYFGRNEIMPLSTADSIESSSSSEDSPLGTLDPTSSLSVIFNHSPPAQNVCAICRIEPVNVFYLKVGVCTGCRAFFRRSIKQKKHYKCLNGRLCGQNALVPTRRACKYCRFQRCIQAGMLESKLQLHSEQREKYSSFSKKIPVVTSDIFLDEMIGEMLQDFLKMRRKVVFEFTANCRRQFGNIRAGDNILNEAKESESGQHDMVVSHIEFAVYDQIVRNEFAIFKDIPDDDWAELTKYCFVQYWDLLGRVLTTMRFNGHEKSQSYNSDGTYHQLSQTSTEIYWSYLYPSIRLDDPQGTYRTVHDYMFGVAVNLVRSVTVAFAKAHLDEVETAALLLLLYTSSECKRLVSEKTKNLLDKCRQETLRGLGAHIKSTGRDISQRMPVIILLITEFQNLSRITHFAMLLIFHATKGLAYPEIFREMVGKLGNFLSPQPTLTDDFIDTLSS
ncbi:unnamed protein product [Bursaphelenchus xylophilus]|uniref:(pine wood nematode) hypothetical protein n=1 Tax=Bursaphelenchus xylophilus TaxID=6326 RepID=A0A1I7S3T0_BURXY|nr:unnamed protein product [Bursaphelenchus xylophilus]CAG9116501.1 unnamed protein product [Bursaphelenchus xylophilus]